MQQLGAIPLIVIAGSAVAAAIAGGAWLWSREREYEAWKRNVPPPNPPPPPPAPQTPDEMRTWNPEQMYERQRQQWRDWAVTGAIPYRITLDPAVLGALVVASVAMIVLLRG